MMAVLVLYMDKILAWLDSETRNTIGASHLRRYCGSSLHLKFLHR